MVRIQNKSHQSFEIYLMTEGGAKTYWITPGKAIVVPSNYLTEQVKLMKRRRILQISNV